LSSAAFTQELLSPLPRDQRIKNSIFHKFRLNISYFPVFMGTVQMGEGSHFSPQAIGIVQMVADV
jgi:hypothetical protein